METFVRFITKFSEKIKLFFALKYLTMNWYSKYISVYEKPLDDVPLNIIQEVKEKLKSKKSLNPLVSVIAIAHNEETRLLSCLWSLCDNKCDLPIEIIVVNNNSTDNTTALLDKLGVTWLNEEKKGPGHARQCGLNNAKGKYHICIDSDTIYPPHYIETMVKSLQRPNVSCVFSLWSFIPDEKHSKIGLFFYELLRDIYLRIQFIKRPELCVRGMVFAFNTEMAREFGFRTDIIRGEDGSLAYALKDKGKLIFICSKKARAITGYGTLNTDGSLFNSFIKRFLKAIKQGISILFKKSDYKDEDSNLINQNKNAK